MSQTLIPLEWQPLGQGFLGPINPPCSLGQFHKGVGVDRMCALCGFFQPHSLRIIEFPEATPPSLDTLGQAPPALQALPSQKIKLSGGGASFLGLINRLFIARSSHGAGTGRLGGHAPSEC